MVKGGGGGVEVRAWSRVGVGVEVRVWSRVGVGVEVVKRLIKKEPSDRSSSSTF